MVDTRVKISSIVSNQLPGFVREEFPLVEEFLSQYYLSLEGQGSTLDILQNIDQYIKVDNLTNLKDFTTLSADVDLFDDVIIVTSTYGFPKSYGLLQIDSEIITYTGITSTSFTGCVRGFSGVTSINGSNTPDELVFSTSEVSTHSTETKVNNLSVLFLKEFFKKIKAQVTPGFEDRTLYSGLNQNIFIKQSKDFYSSKGTDQSFEILFRALYGEDVEVIKPRDYLFSPSNAQYRVTQDLVVEPLEGNPEDLLNRTLFQDQTDVFPAANGSINDVQKITRGNKEYYTLSLDYDFDKDINVVGSVFGKFSIHPQTKLITSVSSGATILDVDSTVGFPKTGTLVVNYSDETFSTITYESKSLNQFFGCSGVNRSIEASQDLRLDAYAYGYSGFSTSNVVKVRVTGVLSDLNILPFNTYYESGDIIKNKTLGIDLVDDVSNNWFFNIATSYNVESLFLENINDFSYKVTTFDEHNFIIGDNISIISNDKIEKLSEIISILNKKQFIIKNQGELNISQKYIIKKVLSKVKSNNYQELNDYCTNVQNVYVDDDSIYIASPSLPSYLNQSLDINDRSAIFSGTFFGDTLTIQNHGFYTGDSVTYIPKNSTNKLNISEGIYFVKRIDENNLKLSKSRSNIYKELYVFISGTVTDNILRYTDFVNKSLNSQKLIRKISNPINDGQQYITNPGLTGILVNGVEILNYKSKDVIYYGPLEKIEVSSTGKDYDIINPPILESTDDTGSGLSAFCEVEGNLKRIEVIDGGFDYLEVPIITVTGGNGIGVVAKPNLITINHSVPFNSVSTANLVDLTNNTIAFSTYHKFRDGELVIYDTEGQTAVGGLSTESSYYVSIQDAFKVQFHKTYSDALSRNNIVDLTSYGVGNHVIKSVNPKKILGSISIENVGSGYKNRKTTVQPSGISTYSNTITIKNHKYKSGEVIQYTAGTSAIHGLSSGEYCVTKIDEDNFKLSQVGIGSTNKDFYYKNNQYINFLSSGIGTQTFNYPEIKVAISGPIGVSTLTGQNFNAILQPIFRGEIKSIFIENGGIGYGSSEILNYNKQPIFNLNSGSKSQLKAIVSAGKIIEVLVLNSGSGYNSIPDLKINGSGKGAILVPIISSGFIRSVKVVSGGLGYNEKNTTIDVIPSGSGAKFVSTPKIWTVNLVDRLIKDNKITSDDGIITNGTNLSFGLQFSHFYAPRKLRQSILASKIVNGQQRYVSDLQLDINGKEILSDSHSPIIGWAYDGNPIYGPYGYDSLTGGSIRIMKSGYSSSFISSHRPNPISSGKFLYPEGFFVEDYIYTNSGDLDEYNGRFCITPEFPNGIYAYFVTIDPISIETNQPFEKYRKPIFPYVIGNKFKSKPISYNFDRYSNQDDVDLNQTNFLRNTHPYNLLNKNSYYDYVINPNKILEQTAEITSANYGIVQSIGIETSGTNYQVGDTVIFDETNTGGFGVSAKISEVFGKTITNISIAKTSVSEVEFVPYPASGIFIGFSTRPHELQNFDIISISGLSTSGTNLDTLFPVGISSNSFILSEDVNSSSVTGIITYFKVSGKLSYPNIRENDILQIETENIKVLNVDSVSSRIRVEREYNGTVGSAHTASSLLIEKSRKFVFNSRVVNTSYEYSKELYFNPLETVGLGTISGVGIGTTIFFSNPGVGITEIFIPTKSLYLPNHNLQTGNELIYYNNGGTSLSISTDGISNFQFTNGQIVYAAKISNDLLGIATSKVGLGTNGSFIGINSSITTDILYFTGIGTGNNHSFKTNPENILKGTVNKNNVTVSTSSTHGLKLYDRVFIDSFPGITTTINISYNDYHRKLVVNPRTFLSSDVNVVENTITIKKHTFVTGEKVIHTSASSSGGLVDNGIYYVYVISEDEIKLCNTITDSQKLNPIVVNITSSSSGTISKINPPLILEKNKTVIFNLSDPSLSFVNNSISYSAFDFNIYSDSKYKNKFYSSRASNKFEITKNGVIGISTDANLRLEVTDFLPEVLFYNLEPINLSLNKEVKKQIISDDENIKNNNSLILVKNALNGEHLLSGIGSTTFSFSLINAPDEKTYSSNDGKFSYRTSSSTVLGGISNVTLLSPGRGYKVLPGISSISTVNGSGAILLPQSNDIGRILTKKIMDIGFDYSADKTLRPQAEAPQILKIEPYYSFNRIGITSIGVNYLIAPNLVVLDSKTNQEIIDVDLNYELGDQEVSILRNTNSLNSVIPNIIPIDNSNGIPISSISFNNSSKDVTVSLGVSFSSINDFPFSIGDTVLIEGISVGIATTAKGYNSSNYNYKLFSITQVNPALGGSNASVTYNLINDLFVNEVPGNFDSANSSGRIIPSKHFPIFDISIKSGKFLKNEIINSNLSNASGSVNSWDSRNGYLKVSSIENFTVNDEILGNTSGSRGKIISITKLNTNYTVDSSSVVKKGWNKQTGFLNDNTQRIHDNDYYQYFSYSIKSKVQYEDWDNAVSSLNHTVGFKKFSDLIVESEDLANVGIQTNQDFGDFISISDLISTVDLNCVNDFDLANEKTINIDLQIYSNEIILNSKIIQDYVESIGNKVLIIDDISNQFNSNPRSTPFSSVDLFTLNSSRSKKYISYIVDKRFTNERQLLLVTLLHNDSIGFLNQYGRIETVFDLGSFDFNIIGSEGQLLFYPTRYTINDYSINLVSYDIKDSISGIGSINLGDTVKISSTTQTLAQGTSSASTIVGIASTYRASKILVQYQATNNSYFEYDELTVIHDGTNVNLLEYGQLTTDTLLTTGSSGLGTYNAYLSGSDLNIDLIPNAGLGVTFNVNTFRVSIANTSSTGISTFTLDTTSLDSRITSIASSTSPVATTIAEYTNDYSCAYYIVSIEDMTNNQYQISEVVVADDGTTPSFTEFGILETGINLGNFDANISGGKTKLTFTPISNTNIEVRVFQNALRLIDTTNTNTTIDFNNAAINTGYGDYSGTSSDIRRAFELTHDQKPIFKRSFDGNSSNVVDISNNLIKIPNHYFVTGEELIYTHSGAGTTQAVGIATTTITGIGLTNKLPTTVYAVKVNDISIRFASSAENALKTNPELLTISSVGIGTSHSLTSKNQNSRVIIGIDNIIQTPIVSTAITTVLSKQLFSTDNTVTISGITSFFGGDLIRINDEIMRINSVGFGSTNVLLVQRSWMGTGLSNHTNGSIVTKVNGDFNIVDNQINFITAPYGLVPIGTTSGNPNDVDYVGIATRSSFSGRSFMRSGVPNTNIEPYSKNYIFDDISTQFTGYSTSFNLTTQGSNVTGLSTDNAIILVNQIFQGPQKIGVVTVFGDYALKENIGITSIQFTGNISSTSYDVNTANVPLGGVIVSVASTSGFGYQPLVSAGGTAIVSGLGTISSISIGNSGSGYRSGIQTFVNVGVITSSLGISNIEFIGIASISNGNIVSVAITNPGLGYTSTNPPIVVFDSPLSYSNIPLVYSSSSVSGLGTGAEINVVVGQGSSIISFEITNFGYGYGQGEILTIGIGGTTGIQTNTSLSFSEFQITVDKTYSDSFSGWSLGSLLVIDPIDTLFDGIRISFPIKVNGTQKTIKAKIGSSIDVQATLLVFINDILQVPGRGYIFNGGSYITFTEPPKVGDTSKILFYQGTSSVDVADVDVLETIKIGDEVRLSDTNPSFDEDDRVVFGINASDSVKTNNYPGPGISLNETYTRPITWCRQAEDKFVDGFAVSKDRILYEPLIYPNTKLIQPISVGSTIVFVENIKTFFDSAKENSTQQNKIKIISQDATIGASATAVVSVAGTISSIIINSGGVGYTTSPTIIISEPIGFGTTAAQNTAKASTTILNGSVTGISVTFAGIGYTNTNPPLVLIEEPYGSSYTEEINNVSYSGDFGIISGISTTSVGVASTGIVFDLLIPQNSFLRNNTVVGSAITVSGIQTGYYFVVFNSNIGNGVTSLNQSGSVVSIGSSFLDNVYEVAAVSIAQTSTVGFGVTYVAKVTVSIQNYNGLTGLGFSNFFGEYSWGRILAPTRLDAKSFNVYNNGLVGISTSPIVERQVPLKYLNYN